MPVRFQHTPQSNTLYFISFTCHKWINLFSITNAYDTVYKWFDYLYANNHRIAGYVIMPNHIHALLYFNKISKPLNIYISNGKRFMAYEIIKRLEVEKKFKLLENLHESVKATEKKKGQRHKVFKDSFDAKECYTTKFIFQKLEYIHKNPISKKWKLINDYTEYPYSSAAFYEKGIPHYDKLLHVNELLS